MILPLRRRHRHLALSMLLTLVTAAWLAWTHPAPSSRMPRLPESLREH